MARRGSRLTALAVLTIGSIVPLPAWAEEAPSAGEAPAPREEPRTGVAAESRDAEVAARRRGQIFRVDLGLSLPSGAMGGSAAGLGAGPLGWTPTVETAFELRLAGPAWGFVRAKGAYWADDNCCSENEAWSAGGDLGVRIELPLFHWLDVGGHVLLGVDVEHARYDTTTGDFLDHWALSGAGAVGLAAHLRPTDFFGVRLSVDLFSAGHARASMEGTEPGTGRVLRQDEAITHAQLTAAPRVELTYTF